MAAWAMGGHPSQGAAAPGRRAVSARTARRSPRRSLSAIGLRRSFIVGVSSSPPGTQSPSRIAKRLDLLDARQVARWRRRPRPATRRDDGRRRPGRRPRRAVGVEHDQRDVVGPPVADRPSPGRSSGPAALSCASMFAGDMFLPAALMISSFLRSTIHRKPSSSMRADVAGVQPAVGVDRLGRAGRGARGSRHHDARRGPAPRRRRPGAARRRRSARPTLP